LKPHTAPGGGRPAHLKFSASTVADPRIEVAKARDKSKMACRVLSLIVLGTATAELLGELARCDAADLVKLFGSPSRRHDRTSPAAADVSTVDTLPADQPTSGPVPAEPEHGSAWGKAGAELSGAVLQVPNPPEPRWDSTDLGAAPIGISPARTHRGRHALLAGEVIRLN
jgi:hypothetical protein